MKELVENTNIVIFIDELHTLVGAGSAEGSLDAANILKPALSRGEIQCIGATTPYEYRRSIEKDRALERRFQTIKVAPPSEDETLDIIQGIKDRYEEFHQVHYTDDAIRAAVFQSSRYITDRFLPDKAIDVLDEAGARVKLDNTVMPDELSELQRKIKVIVREVDTAISEKDFDRAAKLKEEEQSHRESLNVRTESWKLKNKATPEVLEKHVEQVISRWTGIPSESLQEEEMQKLLKMEEELPSARYQPGQRNFGPGPGHPTQPGRDEESEPPGWFVSVSRAHWSRQDRTGQVVGRVSIRDRKDVDPF